MNSVPMPWRPDDAAGARSASSDLRASRAPSCSIDRAGRAAESASRPASRTTAPLRSADLRDLALLARLFALLGCCLLGLVVAGHALTRPSASWSACGDASCCSSSASQPATNGSEAPTSSRPTSDLGREADREDVELRHDARDDAERGVGDDAARAAPARATSSAETKIAENATCDALRRASRCRARRCSGTAS